MGGPRSREPGTRVPWLSCPTATGVRVPDEMIPSLLLKNETPGILRYRQQTCSLPQL